MSAEMLRKASVKMREVAEGNNAQAPVNLPVEAVWINSRQYLVMTPDFALAVADWLTETAHRWEWIEEQDLALAVARAYLGEDA